MEGDIKLWDIGGDAFDLLEGVSLHEIVSLPFDDQHTEAAVFADEGKADQTEADTNEDFSLIRNFFFFFFDHSLYQLSLVLGMSYMFDFGMQLMFAIILSSVLACTTLANENQTYQINMFANILSLTCMLQTLESITFLLLVLYFIHKMRQE